MSPELLVGVIYWFYYFKRTSAFFVDWGILLIMLFYLSADFIVILLKL